MPEEVDPLPSSEAKNCEAALGSEHEELPLKQSYENRSDPELSNHNEVLMSVGEEIMNPEASPEDSIQKATPEEPTYNSSSANQREDMHHLSITNEFESGGPEDSLKRLEELQHRISTLSPSLVNVDTPELLPPQPEQNTTHRINVSNQYNVLSNNQNDQTSQLGMLPPIFTDVDYLQSQPTQSQSISASSNEIISQQNNISQSNEGSRLPRSRSQTPTSVRKSSGPISERLLIPTASQMNYRKQSAEVLEHFPKNFLPPSPPKSPFRVIGASDRLLVPTASQIYYWRQAAEERAMEVDPKEDIWWNQRSPKNEFIDRAYKNFDHVESKLCEPTYASTINHVKYAKLKEPPKKPVKPIDEDSTLLASTFSRDMKLIGNLDDSPEGSPMSRKGSFYEISTVATSKSARSSASKSTAASRSPKTHSKSLSTSVRPINENSRLLFSTASTERSKWSKKVVEHEFYIDDLLE